MAYRIAIKWFTIEIMIQQLTVNYTPWWPIIWIHFPPVQQLEEQDYYYITFITSLLTVLISRSIAAGHSLTCKNEYFFLNYKFYQSDLYQFSWILHISILTNQLIYEAIKMFGEKKTEIRMHNSMNCEQTERISDSKKYVRIFLYYISFCKSIVWYT